MQDQHGIYMVAGSRNAIRLSKLSALAAAYDLWKRGETLIAILHIGESERMEPPDIAREWAALRWPTA
jgi:hypothetical protein